MSTLTFCHQFKYFVLSTIGYAVECCALCQLPELVVYGLVGLVVK